MISANESSPATPMIIDASKSVTTFDEESDDVQLTEKVFSSMLVPSFESYAAPAQLEDEEASMVTTSTTYKPPKTNYPAKPAGAVVTSQKSAEQEKTVTQTNVQCPGNGKSVDIGTEYGNLICCLKIGSYARWVNQTTASSQSSIYSCGASSNKEEAKPNEQEVVVPEPRRVIVEVGEDKYKNDEEGGKNNGGVTVPSYEAKSGLATGTPLFTLFTPTNSLSQHYFVNSNGYWVKCDKQAIGLQCNTRLYSNQSLIYDKNCGPLECAVTNSTIPKWRLADNSPIYTDYAAVYVNINKCDSKPCVAAENNPGYYCEDSSRLYLCSVKDNKATFTKENSYKCSVGASCVINGRKIPETIKCANLICNQTSGRWYVPSFGATECSVGVVCNKGNECTTAQGVKLYCPNATWQYNPSSNIDTGNRFGLSCKENLACNTGPNSYSVGKYCIDKSSPNPVLLRCLVKPNTTKYALIKVEVKYGESCDLSLSDKNIWANGVKLYCHKTSKGYIWDFETNYIAEKTSSCVLNGNCSLIGSTCKTSDGYVYQCVQNKYTLKNCPVRATACVTVGKICDDKTDNNYYNLCGVDKKWVAFSKNDIGSIQLGAPCEAGIKDHTLGTSKTTISCEKDASGKYVWQKASCVIGDGCSGLATGAICDSTVGQKTLICDNTKVWINPDEKPKAEADYKCKIGESCPVNKLGKTCKDDENVNLICGRDITDQGTVLKYTRSIDVIGKSCKGSQTPIFSRDGSGNLLVCKSDKWALNTNEYAEVEAEKPDVIEINEKCVSEVGCLCKQGGLKYEKISIDDYCFVKSCTSQTKGDVCSNLVKDGNVKTCVLENGINQCQKTFTTAEKEIPKPNASIEANSINKVLAQEATTTDNTYLIDPQSGIIAGVTPGQYMFTHNNETYSFTVSNEDFTANNGQITVYIDKNNNSKFDEGTDTKLSDIATQITLNTIAKNYTYNLVEGYNFVSFPFVIEDPEARDAIGFIEYINSKNGDLLYSIARYDSAWKIVGSNGDDYSVNNFQMLPGVGYILKATRAGSISIFGNEVKYETEADKAPVYLSTGWNLVSIYGSKAKAYTAESWIDGINAYEDPDFTAVNVTRWPSDLQRYDGLQKEDVNGVSQVYGFDFPINQSSAYFVRILSGKGNWNPELEQ